MYVVFAPRWPTTRLQPNDEDRAVKEGLIELRLPPPPETKSKMKVCIGRTGEPCLLLCLAILLFRDAGYYLFWLGGDKNLIGPLKIQERERE